MEVIPYGGWDRCARIVSGDLEMIVTLEVGPRIIRFGQIGGRMSLSNTPKTWARRAATTTAANGGHRLWIAPEEVPKTYCADNQMVEYHEESGWHVFTAPREDWLIQKEIRIKPLDGSLHSNIGSTITMPTVSTSPYGP